MYKLFVMGLRAKSSSFGIWIASLIIATSAFGQSVTSPPSSFEITHDLSNNNQVFPLQLWRAAGSTRNGIDVKFELETPFVHTYDADFKMDAAIGLTIIGKAGPAKWSVTKPKDETNVRANDSEAFVTASSDGFGRANLGVSVETVSPEWGTYAAGNYVTTIVGTLQEAGMAASQIVSSKGSLRPPRRTIATESNDVAIPGYEVSQLVQKLSGAPGDLLKFSFDIESLDEASNVHVKAVVLRQHPNGSKFYTELPLPSEGDLEISIDSPQDLHLEAREKSKIEGTVRVPNRDKQFYSYGILVCDDGNPVRGTPLETYEGDHTTRFKILFKTQYLLRIDVLVEEERSQAIELLQVGNVKCVEVKGRPALQMVRCGRKSLIQRRFMPARWIGRKNIWRNR